MHVPSCVLNGYTHLPLVIMLHGYTERGDKYAGIDPTSDYSDQWVDEGNRPNPDGCFVTVWPQGLETQQGVDPSYVVSSWNAGGCSTLGTSGCDFNEVFALYGGGLCAHDAYCGDTCAPCSWCTCVDDVGFLITLTHHLKDPPGGDGPQQDVTAINPNRIYVAGCSNGGMMAFELAQRAPPGLYAGFATNCGTYHPGSQCAPFWSHPQIHIHATDDPTIPYDGTPSTDDGAWVYESVDNALSGMEASAGCATTPSTAAWVSLASLDPASSTAATQASLTASGLPWLYGLALPNNASRAAAISQNARCRLRAKDCANGAQFVLCTGEFGHDWPLWAAAVSWKFLKQFEAVASTPAQSLPPPPPQPTPPGSMPACVMHGWEAWHDPALDMPVSIGSEVAMVLLVLLLVAACYCYYKWRELPEKRARAVRRQMQMSEVTNQSVDIELEPAPSRSLGLDAED